MKIYNYINNKHCYSPVGLEISSLFDLHTGVLNL